jgi:hypothetical protein
LPLVISPEAMQYIPYEQAVKNRQPKLDATKHPRSDKRATKR